MARPLCLFTGQWADLPIETLAEMAHSFGYEGLELACWGDHFEVEKAVKDRSYCQGRWELLMDHGLTPLGSLIAGIVAEFFGVSTTVLIGGIATMSFVLLIGGRFGAIRAFRS